MALLCILMLLAAVVTNSIQSPDDATTTPPIDPNAYVEPTYDVTNGTELVFAFLVFRHGDVKPVPYYYKDFRVNSNSIKNDTPALRGKIRKAYIALGELTKAGKRTAYKLGQFIRRRYDKLLSPQYNFSDIYIRTTDVRRTAMTVLTAMAAVYPDNHTWSNTINYDPVPYTTAPFKEDFILAPTSCTTMKTFVDPIITTPNPRMNQFTDLLNNVSKIIGINITAQPTTVLRVHESYANKISLGHKIPEELLPLMPAMKQAADEAMDIIYGDHRFLNLQAGVLLNEFFTYARKIMAGEQTPRVRVYSGHDFNVYSLMALSRLKPRQGAPKYGSLYSLELRRDPKTGEYFVLPVYLPEPGAKEMFLTIRRCDLLCEFEVYYYLKYTYLLTEDQWLIDCGLRKVPVPGPDPSLMYNQDTWFDAIEHFMSPLNYRIRHMLNRQPPPRP